MHAPIGATDFLTDQDSRDRHFHRTPCSHIVRTIDFNNKILRNSVLHPTRRLFRKEFVIFEPDNLRQFETAEQSLHGSPTRYFRKDIERLRNILGIPVISPVDSPDNCSSNGKANYQHQLDE